MNKPIVGMSVVPNGFGYWLAAVNGGIFTYGNVSFNGSAGGNPPVFPVVVAVAVAVAVAAVVSTT